MRRIWAVARVTIREALRQKSAVMLIVLLALLLPALGFSVKGDATLPGRAQMFLDYSLRVSRLLLALMTVFAACGTMAWELKYRQAYVTLTKPLPRWQFFLGKWVGLSLLNLALLVAVWGVIEGFAWYFRHVPAETPQQRRQKEILQKEVLIARASLKPMPPIDQIRDAVDRKLKQLMDTGQMPPGQSERQYRNELFNRYMKRWRTVGPLQARSFNFEGLQTAKRKAGYIQIRYYIVPGRATPSNVMSYIWQVGTPGVGKVYIVPRVNEPVRTKHTIRVPADAITDDGKLTVTFINMHPDGRQATFPASAIFSGETGLEVLYPAGDFGPNVARALAMIWLQLVFLAALGLCAASFLTFPTACLMCLLIFFAGSGVGYLLDAMHWVGKDPSAFVAGRLVRVTGPIIKGFLRVIPDFSRYTPSDAIVDGKLVGWDWLRSAAIHVGLLRTGAAILLGCVIITRREVAQVVV